MVRRGVLARRSRGFILVTILAILALGTLYLILEQLSPLSVAALRARKTDAALNTARDALVGYMARFREDQANDGQPGKPYGYVMLPDLGSSRNNNPASNCVGGTGNALEGCDANAFTGIAYDANGLPPTVIGRFPWRALGTGPLRDGQGECLWLAVSSTHGRILRGSPVATPPAMNWDTVAQLDIHVARGTTALATEIANAHDRPLLIVFAPGPPLAGQDRGASLTDNVTECGGNYGAANYLDPKTLTALGGVSNYFNGATNQASGDTTAIKPFSTYGVVQRNTADGTLWAENCPANGACEVVANDRGLALKPDQVFRAVRNSASFRADVNTLLERMVGCLRDQIASGTAISPVAMTGIGTPPSDKSVGKIPASASSCYGDGIEPLGYFANYADQILVAACNPIGACLSVTRSEDGSTQNCAASLIFAGQRGTAQYRSTDTERGAPANYLEGGNLTAFITTGATAFAGPANFGAVTSSQPATQDIVRCVPASASQSTVASSGLSANEQLVNYDAATRTLTLGNPDETEFTESPTALYGCAWSPEDHQLAGGLRGYFNFSFATVGTNVGNTGFVHALIDAESNLTLPCGAAGNHLGYSGDNGSTARLLPPKLGIEFDQSRNFSIASASGYSESAFTTNVGRGDPCGTAPPPGCLANVGYNTHAALVYWGHESTNATDSVARPNDDDNVHGYPSTAALALMGTRHPPRNPLGPIDPAVGTPDNGLKLINLRNGGDVFHVRVEIFPTRTVASPAENSKTTLLTKVWILLDSPTSANQIAALKNTARPMSELYPSFTETLSDTASVFDVAMSACSSGTCPSNQTCGSDNICYRQGFRKVRLGFTNSQRTQDQLITIRDIITTWLP